MNPTGPDQVGGGEDSRFSAFWESLPEPARTRLRETAARPHLTREEDRRLALRIRRTRRILCRRVLVTDYALEQARGALDGVRRGELAAGYIGFGLQSDEERQRVVDSLPFVMQQLEQIVLQNRTDLETLLRPGETLADSDTRWASVRSRRREGARLVEGVQLHPARVYSIMREFEGLAGKMRRLVGRRSLVRPGSELYRLMLQTGETPDTILERVRRMRKSFERYDRVRRRLAEGTAWLIVAIAERFHNHLQRAGVPFLRVLPECEVQMLKAAERYDPDATYRFATYATWWVRNALTRALTGSRE